MFFVKHKKTKRMWYLNFKIALRTILKNPGFSLINIGGLAIGLACCLILMLYVKYEMSYDSQFTGSNRIYYTKLNLNMNGSLLTIGATPNRLAAAGMQSVPGVEAAARIRENQQTLFSHKENRFKLEMLTVDPSFLKIFDYHYIYGTVETALAEPSSILLTATTAKKLFGSENPLGQRITWDNRKDLKVTAVIADLPKNQSLQFQALQTWALFDQENPDSKNNGWALVTCATIFKLKANAPFEAADNAMRKLIANNDKTTVMEAFLLPFTKFHLYNKFENGKPSGGRIDMVRLFGFLALCVLLIASINYMNLSTARSEKRAKEVGVRKAMGSDRSALMGQFFLESLLLSFIAMVIAFALLELSLPYFNSLLDITIPIQYHSFTFWLTLVALVLLTGVLAGSYPAFYLSSFTPVKVLKGFTNIGSSSLPIRKILVVVQFTLSICMIICAIVIYSQIQYIKNKPLGFNQDNLVQMDREGELMTRSKLELLKARLIKEEAIVSATEYPYDFTANGGEITGDLSWPGKNVKEVFTINYRSVGYDYTRTTGTEIVAGRDFSRDFAADTSNSILMNEAALKLMELKNPIGTMIKWGDKPFKIVGIIKDYYNVKPGLQSPPTIFYNSSAESHVMLFRLNPEKSLSTSIQLIKNAGQELNPAYPTELKFVNEGMDEKLQEEKILGVLSNLFGGFAIFISCIGLLGLALFMAEQRKKEIGIRKVLGADLTSILVLLNKDFMKLVILSNIVAFPVAYILASNWLKKYDYKVELAYWPFLVAASVSIFVALLTVSIQSVKVAKSNPVSALKYE